MYEWVPTLTVEEGLAVGVVALSLLVASMATERVPDHQRIAVASGQRYRKLIGPGFGIVVPLLDDLYVIDLRERSFEATVETSTQDGAAARATVAIQWHVDDAEDAFREVADYERATRETARAVTRRLVGERHRTTVVADPGVLAGVIREELGDRAEEWGVEIERVAVEEVSVRVGQEPKTSSAAW